MPSDSSSIRFLTDLLCLTEPADNMGAVRLFAWLLHMAFDANQIRDLAELLPESCKLDEESLSRLVVHYIDQWGGGSRGGQYISRAEAMETIEVMAHGVRLTELYVSMLRNNKSPTMNPDPVVWRPMPRNPLQNYRVFGLTLATGNTTMPVRWDACSSRHGSETLRRLQLMVKMADLNLAGYQQILKLLNGRTNHWYPQRPFNQDTSEFLHFCCDISIPSGADNEVDVDSAENRWGLNTHEEQVMAARCQIYFDILSDMGLRIVGLGNHTPQ